MAIHELSAFKEDIMPIVILIIAGLLSLLWYPLQKEVEGKTMFMLALVFFVMAILFAMVSPHS